MLDKRIQPNPHAINNRMPFGHQDHIIRNEKFYFDWHSASIQELRLEIEETKFSQKLKAGYQPTRAEQIQHEDNTRARERAKDAKHVFRNRHAEARSARHSVISDQIKTMYEFISSQPGIGVLGILAVLIIHANEYNKVHHKPADLIRLEKELRALQGDKTPVNPWERIGEYVPDGFEKASELSQEAQRKNSVRPAGSIRNSSLPTYQWT
ncbi:MAG: hypothetical protein AB7H77_11640 [Bdellovibrionales bacterium]